MKPIMEYLGVFAKPKKALKPPYKKAQHPSQILHHPKDYRIIRL
jgi:hypothetical protein